jgi:hypothetical protein
MLKLIGGCFLMLLTLSSVFAGEQRRIELTDGSIIVGEIVSFSQGVYTINSGHFGVVKIDDSKIRAIESSSGGSGESSLSDLQGLQHQIMGDPDLMSTILSLQDDPDVQAALQDQQVMSAVASGDIGALLSLPVFMKLLENPRIKEIARDVGAQ